MRLQRFVSAVLAGLLLASPAATRAEERILSFVSEVNVGKDGSLEVTETIRVLSEGVRIKRGIYRDFPLRSSEARRDGPTVGFTVRSVGRDGAPEPWVEEMHEAEGYRRVRMGDAAVLLPPGEHSYVLRYRTTGQLGRSRIHDELYWNVTGIWPFAIDGAEARINLPSPARFGDRAFYTGSHGSTARDAEVMLDTPGHIVIRTTRPLGAEEGLTVAVTWPKGVTVAPAKPRRGKD